MNIALVSMPFGPLFAPSIALGLLKQIAKKHKCGVDVHYCNLDYAKLVGERFYHDIASGLFPTHSLIGEWLFSAYFHDENSTKNNQFIDDIVRPLFVDGNYVALDRSLHADEFIRQLLDARKIAIKFIEDCASRILDTSPKIIGITSVFQQHVASLALAKEIKVKNPNVFVVLGGANCEGLMGKSVINYAPWVDAVVSGEGENAFDHIVAQLNNRKDPAQHKNIHLASKKLRIPMAAEIRALDETIDLNKLPIPDYSDYFEQLSRTGVDRSFVRVQIPFETARGCWWGEKHHCTFCGLNGQSMSFRSKSADRAFNELVELTKKYPGNAVAVTDNILDMQYFRDFLPLLSKSELGVELFYEVKANLSLEQLKVLKSAGVTHIQPGIESFSDEVLGLMRKGVRAIQNVQLLHDCAEIGIVPEWNLIWGFPQENPVEYEITTAMLPSFFHLRPPQGASQLRLDRFSPLFESADELGIISPKPAPAYEYVYPFDYAILGNLAYYFEFSYAEERNVSSYTHQLRDLIRRWKQEYHSSELVSVDKGSMLLLWDTRSSRDKPLTVLNGIKREIYLHFAKAASKASLLSEIEICFHPFVDEFIKEMISKRLMVEINGRILALAVSLDNYDPGTEGIEALTDAIRKISNTSEHDDNLVIPIDLYASVTPLPPNIAFKRDCAKARSPLTLR